MAKAVKQKQEFATNHKRLLMEIYSAPLNYIRGGRSSQYHSRKLQKFQIGSNTRRVLHNPPIRTKSSNEYPFAEVLTRNPLKRLKKRRRRIQKSYDDIVSWNNTKKMQSTSLFEIQPVPDRIFTVHPGNNWEVIKSALYRRGWTEAGPGQQPSFVWKQLSKGLSWDKSTTKIQNHFQKHKLISTKARLLNNLRFFWNKHGKNVFDYMPVTFEFDISSAFYIIQAKKFKACWDDIKRGKETEQPLPPEHSTGKNVWILKPTGYNRGQGIHVFSKLEEFDKLIEDYRNIANGMGVKHYAACKVRAQKFIVQKYIESPLLVERRKFDIRVWVLVTQSGKPYVFREGYLRTSSQEFSLEELDKPMVHLTNNAVQKHGQDYGSHEPGNQLSYAQFQDYLSKTESSISVNDDIIPKTKHLIKISLKSVKRKMNPSKLKNCFEIFGYDFMVDSAGGVWLLEVNTNPCLELSSPLLEQLIPRMIDDAFKIVVDPVFEPQQKSVLESPEVLPLPDENLWEEL